MLDRHNRKVARFLEEVDEELERLRTTLERPNKTADEYNVIRGQIKGLRWVVEKATNDEDDLLNG